MNLKKRAFYALFLAFCNVFSLFFFSVAAQSNGNISLEDAPIKSDLLPSGTVFFGESTTTHLRSRGGLSKEQVWANESGTMRLDSALLSRRITDPQTQNPIAFLDAIRKYQPSNLVFSFGLNGIVGFSENPSLYLQNYQNLIEKASHASPNTRIWVQTVYPVAKEKHQTAWNFSLSPSEINEKILEINQLLTDFSKSIDGVSVIDTASVIRDAEGFLPSHYTTDGIHLTSAAYEKILDCIKRNLVA